MGRKITIGTRGSDLALWQANFIKTALTEQGHTVELQIIKTQGDQITNLSLDKLEGKGFFTKELEQALLNHEIDLAVHSFKDLPTESPQGLSIAATTERESASELLIIDKKKTDIKQNLSLKTGTTIGTSSNRRKSQLLAFRPDLNIKDLRGNIPTRIQKLAKGQYDAILIAQAGIKRLGIDLSDFEVIEISPNMIIPAPAQGALALQIRENDIELNEILKPLNHNNSAETVEIERKVLNLFGGGCHTPIGCYCIKQSGKYKVWTSKSAEYTEFPDRIYIESKSKKTIAEKIIKAYENISSKKLPKSVFISRELSNNSYLKQVLNKHQIAFQDYSLIKTFPTINKLDAYILDKIDWIFFSSKNGIEFFFALNPTLSNQVKFGTMGKGSAETLRKYGHQADFIGDHIDPKYVAEQLSYLLDGKSVLFPRAKDSLKNVQNNLPKTIKVIDLPIYETILNKNIRLSDAEILIFTSPSNAEAYFMQNLLEDYQRVIAIGRSTSKKLADLGIKQHLLPATPDEIGIAELFLSISQ